MHRLTARGIYYGMRCRPLDDFVFLPKFTVRLSHVTAAEKARNDEYLRGIDDEYGDIWIMNPMPYTHLNYGVLSSGAVIETIHALNLHRLSGVRQLGTLVDPVMMSYGENAIANRFSHNRFGHSLDVAAMATVIGWNCGLDDRDRLHLRVACVMHDALTPAHGDGTKLIDPKAFDEDANIRELFKKPEWVDLKAKWQIDEELIVKIIQDDNHWLGSIRNMADRICYIARDVSAYLIESRSDRRLLLPFEHEAVRQSVYLRPHLLHVWDTLRMKDGQLVCSDPDTLDAFLRLRVQMFQSLYYHPLSRVREFIFSKVIVQYLYDSGQVSRDQLLEMTDEWLDREINRLVGRESGIENLDTFGNPRAACYKDAWTARNEEARLRMNGIRFIFAENLQRKIKPGIDFPVLVGGRVMPFKEARPALARDLVKLAKIQFPYRLYWLEKPNVSAEFLKAYDAFQLKRGR